MQPNLLQRAAFVLEGPVANDFYDFVYEELPGGGVARSDQSHTLQIWCVAV